MNELLNIQLCKELRGVINETDIFIKDQEESKKFNLICAIMDRFDSAVVYINNHLNKPENETDFIVFMMYCCIIKDGINYIFEQLKIPLKRDNGLFKGIYEKEPLNVSTEDNFTDDKFFEYFRSLVFAHPFLTTRAIPSKIAANEIQYSPYTLIDLHGLRKENDSIGVRVYSNKRNPFSIIYSFDILKEYIKWKYNMLTDIIKGFKDIIESKEKVWKEHKVNRDLDPLEILVDIKSIMEERYIETYDVDELISDLNCESSKTENNEDIQLYKDAIINIIPEICDAVDSYNHDEVYEIIRNVIRVRPKGYPMLHYQLEKIFCYLTDYNPGENVEWGLIQAEAFAEKFAKKWVVIEPYNMSFNEIKMLTNVACYLEYQEQKTDKVS